MDSKPKLLVIGPDDSSARIGILLNINHLRNFLDRMVDLLVLDSIKALSTHYITVRHLMNGWDLM